MKEESKEGEKPDDGPEIKSEQPRLDIENNFDFETMKKSNSIKQDRHQN